jgi:lipoprotein NlpD
MMKVCWQMRAALSELRSSRPTPVARGTFLRCGLKAGALACLGTLAACSSTIHRAPVEERAVPGRSVSVPTALTPSKAAPPSPAPKPGSAVVAPANVDAADLKPGQVVVKPGDTLGRIGLESGQSWRDIARWNRLDNPNLIEVGQVLWVRPPPAGASSEGVAVSLPVGSGTLPQTRPASSAEAGAGATAAAPASALNAPSDAATTTTAAPEAGKSARDERVASADRIDWIWPAKGPVIQGFDPAKGSKGVSIGGQAGDPIVAAADGRVVYVGSGLRGYGNLIILKHNDLFLSAYAHNQTLLVKEDQVVRKGQKIAEMGATDADRVKLHLEIRRQGQPQDPLKWLPSR